MTTFSLLTRHDGALIDLLSSQTTINHTTLKTLIEVHETSRKGYAMQGIRTSEGKDFQPAVYSFPIYSTRTIRAVGSKVYFYDFQHPVNTQAKLKIPHRMHIAFFPDKVGIKITVRKPGWWHRAENYALFSAEIPISTFDRFEEEWHKAHNPYGRTNTLAGTRFA